MATIPGCTHIGSTVIKGVEFAVDVSDAHHFIGHCWVRDEANLQVYALIDEGPTWSEMEENLEDLIDSVCLDVWEETGIEPRLIGLGSEFDDPPPVFMA